jgi:hypothetical protein
MLNETDENKSAPQWRSSALTWWRISFPGQTEELGLGKVRLPILIPISDYASAHQNGQSLDNYIAIPISAYLKQYGSHNSIRVSGKAHGVGSQLNAAIDEVRVVLRARRHDAPGQPDSFVAETNENFLSLWKALTQTLCITITAIAAIAPGWGASLISEHHAGVG